MEYCARGEIPDAATAFFNHNPMKTFSLVALLPFATVALAGTVQAAPETKSAAAKIDAILKKDWEKHGLKGNPAADDNAFVRRLYLDIVGRIPTTRETEEFITSKAADKRAKLIDKLLASEGYVQHAFNYWADVLRAQSNGNQAGPVTGAAYTNYLKDSLRKNRPYDELVREMIAAEGRSWENGAIGYYMRDRGMPLDNMANTVRVFLGTRIECAQCHNHPFDKWTQMQFYKMAAFTYGVETNDYYGYSMAGARDLLREQVRAEENKVRAKFKPPVPANGKRLSPEERKIARNQQEQLQKQARLVGEAMRKEQRYVDDAITDVRNNLRYTALTYKEERKVRLPHDYQYDDAKPKSTVEAGTMFGHEANAKAGEKPLDAYARWLASPDNDRFNKVIANRLWKRAFGMALIEPLDELMDTSQPMIPELQAHLEKLIVDLDYDMKAYLRIVYNTSAYQRQVTREEIAPGIAYHFTGPLLRRMTAEQMWDSFVTLINPNPDMPNEPLREQAENRILAAKKLSDSEESLTPEEVLAGAEVSAKKYKALADKVRDLQRRIAEARAKEDKPLSEKLRAELRLLERETRGSVNKNIVLPGMQKLATKLEVTPVVYQGKNNNSGVVAATDMSMMMAAAAEGDVKDRIFIPGYDKPSKTKEQLRAEQEAREDRWKDEAAYFKLNNKELKSYFRARADQVRNWVRSAELESPAPRGHYLREFGQSDRETIENANHEASVPQALAMMNGQLMPQILNRYSQLMLTVSKAEYPDDKVEAVYMAVLSRKPTQRERDVWMKAQAEAQGATDKSKELTEIQDLVFALLNTQQFIFVQ